MKINNIDNTNFSAVKTSYSLFTRLNTLKRYEQFEQFKHSQLEKPYDIIITLKNNGGLSATAIRKDNMIGLSKDEGFFSRIFNMNPVRFLEKFAKEIEKYGE